MLAPTRCAKFNEYVPVHVAPYIKGITQPYGKIDLLWDEYPDENLCTPIHSVELDHIQNLEIMVKLLFQEEIGSAIWQTKTI